MISTTGRFVFIHVPKTAGSSITSALSHYSDDPVQFSSIGSSAVADKHKTASFFQRTRGIAWWDSMRSFAVVRNPWERVVSLFLWLKKSNHPSIAKVNSVNAWLAGDISCRPASVYIESRGSIIVDRVIRFETLEQDFINVCRDFCLRPKRLPFINKTNHDDYRSFYTDATSARVASLFRRDIELFGYKFEDGPS